MLSIGFCRPKVTCTRCAVYIQGRFKVCRNGLAPDNKVPRLVADSCYAREPVRFNDMQTSRSWRMILS